MTVLGDPLEVMVPDPAQSGADILPEYDFAHGVRGKHHEAYKAGTNVIFLESDLAKVFKDSDSSTDNYDCC